MAKILKKKNIRFLIIVAIVLVFSIPLIFISRAAPFAGYVSRVSGANANLSGAARTDVDNLFVYMMNKSLPVGSIYITTEYATVGEMNDNFGGTWVRWGEGRVPVGVDPNDVRFDTPGKTGGFTSVPGSASMGAAVNLPVSGTIELTDGAAYFTGTATLIPGTVKLNGSTTVYSDYFETSAGVGLTSDYLPSHSHADADVTKSQHKGWGSAGAINCGSQNTYDPGQDYNTTVVPGTVTFKSIGGSAPFSVGYPIDLSDTTKFGANLNLPNSYSVPTIDYMDQEVDWDSSNTDAVASVSGTLDWTDQTVQPYVTVYMYKRETLPLLEP